MTPFPKVDGGSLSQLYDWAKRVIVWSERGTAGVTGITVAPANFLSVTPTVAHIPQGSWGVFKNTLTGAVVLAYNDAGLIKKVTLT